MPDVNAAGSSAPPVSGSLEDPRRLDRAETESHGGTFPDDAPDPDHQAVLDVNLELNRSPGQLDTGGEKTSGDDESACGQPRNREEVIKEIGISSAAFIGPARRPQPEIEDELSEFYKELAEIDQPDTTDENSENVSRSCAPSDAVDGNVTRVSRSFTPSVNPAAVKEKQNDHRNPYRPYPETRIQTDYRNTPQYRPQSHWSNPHSYQNHFQLPPPNFRFHPPPRPRNPMPPPYPQPQQHQRGQPDNSGFWFGPDHLRLAWSPSPAPCPPYEAFERQQNHQDANQHWHSDGPPLVLILMRGLPGSGKSSLARQISSSGPSGVILSTDDYFYQEDGYHFEPTLLAAAHDWNQNRARKAMLDVRTPVIIDNTNIQAWEMKPYVTSALETGYRVQFVEPDTSWKHDPVELEKRNHHGVPRETIAHMLDRFELPISVDIVMSSCEPFHKRKELHFRPYR